MQKNLFHFQIAVKEMTPQEDNKSVVIRGFASTPDIDRYNDIVEPQAFAEALELYMKNPTLLRSHNADEPAGYIKSAVVTSKGLLVEAVVNEPETVEDVKQNRMRAFSIGYIALESTLQHKDGTPFNAEKDNPWDPDMVRVIKKLDLVEISIVSTPANGNALFTMAESFKSLFRQLAFKGMNIKNTPPVNEASVDEVKTDEVETTEEKIKDESAVEDKQENETEADNGEEKVVESDDKSENAGETPVADSAETQTGEEAKADDESQEETTEAEPKEVEVLEVDENTAKSMPDLVEAGLIKESKSAEAFRMPSQLVTLVKGLIGEISQQANEIKVLSEKLDAMPKKQSIKVIGQFGEDSKPKPKSNEPTDAFKQMFNL